MPQSDKKTSQTSPVENAYLAKVAAGEIRNDPIQAQLSRELDVLAVNIEAKQLGAKSSALGWIFSKRQKKASPKGLYIWGSVGRGKSMLMDMFFHSVSLKKKRRVHFHDFMENAQSRIHAQRQDYKDGKSREEDPIPPVARDLADEAALLCFDEFSVTDIADAMILGRLFQGLFSHGVTIVATSNVAPENLYKDGLNRQRFLPFIDLLTQHCDVFELDAQTDYRLEKLSGAPVYLAPLGPKATKSMEEIWLRMTGGAEETTLELKIKGRKVSVPRAVDGHARFDFSDLCEKPLGAQDYLMIARNFHTVFIDNIPMMDISRRNHAKRFINLIDTLYDQRIKVVVSAAANPHVLYSGKSGTEAFEFERTASRLIEMQSTEYLAGQG